MRKIVLPFLLLSFLAIPNFVTAKHAEKLHAKMSEHGHKKRMKKAMKESKPKHSLHHKK